MCLKIVVELLYSCGLRVSELCNLNINNINLKENKGNLLVKQKTLF